ncbi:hypothetical protein ACFVXE_11290 [Streptomyces sp. NPDC058231]|uniref:hypothetical protein n=1 Tax=Streptomyces sp. NPDC058231 TaxID=3346392 RepID=UPI0036E89325
MTVLFTPFVGFVIIAMTAAAIPVAMLDHPKGFAQACLVVGAGLLAWATVGAIMGMFLFLPAAVLFLVAAYADGGNRPGARWLLGALCVAAAAAVIPALILFAP